MPAVKERLSRLLMLASERRWTALADTLAGLAFDWPADFPEVLRPTVKALLLHAVRETDAETRRRLAARLGGHGDLPLTLLLELYLEAPAPVRREILMRSELESGEEYESEAADAAMLLAAARQDSVRDFAAFMCGAFHLSRHIAEAILVDASGEPLAVLCRGAGIDRATFTALALLRGAQDLPLAAYDTVPDRAAKRITSYWRSQAVLPYPEHIQAAE